MQRVRAGVSQQLLPACDCGSLCNLASTILRSFGVADPPSNLLPAPEVLDALTAGRRVVLLVLDSLGYLSLQAHRSGAGRVFHQLGERGFASRITSVFPSTTAAALPSLYTGYTPQQHGMLGYRMYLHEYDVVADMLNLSPVGEYGPDGLAGKGMRHWQFMGVPTVFERLGRLGIRTAALCRGRYSGTGLSKLLYRGADELLPLVAFSDLCVQVRKRLLDPEGPRFVFAYWDTLDGIAHQYGPDSEEYAAELRALGATLEREWLEHKGLRGPGVTLLVTADHGQLEVDPALRLKLGRYPSLTRRLRVPATGCSRAAYLHCLPGEEDSVRCFFRDRVGDAFSCTPSQRLLHRGFFGRGKLHRHTVDRVGTFTLLPEGPGTVEAGRADSSLRGRHGGLSPEEMLVPLLCCSL